MMKKKMKSSEIREKSVNQAGYGDSWVDKKTTKAIIKAQTRNRISDRVIEMGTLSLSMKMWMDSTLSLTTRRISTQIIAATRIINSGKTSVQSNLKPK